jgi:hypothetical protein
VHQQLGCFALQPHQTLSPATGLRNLEEKTTTVLDGVGSSSTLRAGSHNFMYLQDTTFRLDLAISLLLLL